MTFKDIFFSFDGRINRATYWNYMLILIGLFIFMVSMRIVETIQFLPLIFVILIFLLQTKRCRDIGWSPFFVVLTFVPYVNLVWIVILGLRESNRNQPISCPSCKITINIEYLLNSNNSYTCPHCHNGFKAEIDEVGKVELTKTKHNRYNQQSYYNNQNNQQQDYKILICLRCAKSIKISSPPSLSNIYKCPHCKGRYKPQLDVYGEYIFYLLEDNQQYSNKNEIQEALKILGLNSTAKTNEIKKAYRKLMSDYHPDKVSTLGEALQKLAEEKSKEINSAYDLLKKRGVV